MRRYAVVFEKAAANLAAYAPDLPGCITTGATLEEAKRNMREVGEPLPPPTADIDFVELETAAF